MVSSGPDVYYQNNFRHVVESYIPYLREHPTTQVIGVEPDIAYRYEGDFYGLLKTMRVPAQYHWIILRLNNMVHPADFKEIGTAIMIPAVSEIENIVRLFKVTHSIT